MNEQTFSILDFRENKFCSKLTDEHLHQQPRITTMDLKPNIDKPSEDIIPQKSH
jgi:hypothetical protein